MKNLKFLILCFLVFSFAGCADSEDEPVVVAATVATTATGSCDNILGNYTFCYQYTDKLAATITTAKSSCENTSYGTWADTACVTTTSVGSCVAAGTGESGFLIYYTGGYTAATAETACTASGGTWAAASIR